jgi:hypothetical protein
MTRAAAPPLAGGFASNTRNICNLARTSATFRREVTRLQQALTGVKAGCRRRTPGGLPGVAGVTKAESSATAEAPTAPVRRGQPDLRITTLTFIAFYLNAALDSGRYDDLGIEEVTREIDGGTIFPFDLPVLRRPLGRRHRPFDHQCRRRGGAAAEIDMLAAWTRAEVGVERRGLRCCRLPIGRRSAQNLIA